MSTPSHSPANLARIDEQAIGVLRLPPNAHPHRSDPCFLALVRDAGRPWRCLMSQGFGLIPHGFGQPYGEMPDPFDWPSGSQIIRTACEHRAVLTVDGTLRVARRRVTPETYLRSWRRAIEKASDITGWRTLDSVRPVARFEFEAELLKHARSRRTKPAFEDLQALSIDVLASGTGVLVPAGQPVPAGGAGTCAYGVASTTSPTSPTLPASLLRLELAIDLIRPEGARQAWWANDMLRAAAPADPPWQSAASIEMTRLAASAADESCRVQLALFGSVINHHDANVFAEKPAVA